MDLQYLCHWRTVKSPLEHKHVRSLAMCGNRGGGGGRGSGPPSLETHKAIGFLSNTHPDPLEKANIQII